MMSIKTVVKELILLVCFTVNIFVLQRLVVKLVPKYLQTGEGVNKYWQKVKGGWGKPINFVAVREFSGNKQQNCFHSFLAHACM